MCVKAFLSAKNALKMCIRRMGFGNVDWIEIAQIRVHFRDSVIKVRMSNMGISLSNLSRKTTADLLNYLVSK
jgi:hypothetical protein